MTIGNQITDYLFVIEVSEQTPEGRVWKQVAYAKTKKEADALFRKHHHGGGGYYRFRNKLSHQILGSSGRLEPRL